MLHYKILKPLQPLVSAVLLTLTFLCVACSPRPPLPRPSPGECVNFRDRREGEQVAARYSKNGFVFETANGQTQQIYLATGPNELGLRLSIDGIKVSLPQPASQVNLRLVYYHGSSSIEVIAHDAAGNIVDRASAPATPQDVVHRLSLTGRGISVLKITGGEGDGVLLEVCIAREIGECVNFRDRRAGEQVAARYSKDGFV